MIKTLQIVALLQGLFLIFVLLKKRSHYKKTTFWLFLATIISVILYIIGDDENNLFFEGLDLFLLDTSLFITFLFLFFRYYKSNKVQFTRIDYLYFVPNIVYFIIESIEIGEGADSPLLEILELLVELTFLTYLVYIIYDVIAHNRKNWVLYFAIPISLILGLAYFNDVLIFFEFAEIQISNDQNIDTYLLLTIAFLFYFLTFKLITKANEILPKSKLNKYKTSNLNHAIIKDCKDSLTDVMENEKLYMDTKLSIHAVSEKIKIPRQYISEVLNLHMQTSFQDYVNGYRVKEFIKLLAHEKYSNYTLFGIANEVGFNSKSSFNAAFKKHKGCTPTQYKESYNKDGEVVQNN